MQTASRFKEANGGGISTGWDFDIPVPSPYPPQILGSGGHRTALPAGPHLGFWPPLHQQRVSSHGLSLHHLQRLPGCLHLRVSLRLTEEGEVTDKVQVPAICSGLCLLQGEHGFRVREDLARGGEGTEKELDRGLEEQESRVALGRGDRGSPQGVGHEASVQKGDDWAPSRHLLLQ